jgi:hypothetical protein
VTSAAESFMVSTMPPPARPVQVTLPGTQPLTLNSYPEYGLTASLAGSASSELFGRGPAGVCCAAQEAGEELKIVILVLRADLVHRGVHP